MVLKNIMPAIRFLYFVNTQVYLFVHFEKTLIAKSESRDTFSPVSYMHIFVFLSSLYFVDMLDLSVQESNEVSKCPVQQFNLTYFI